MPWCDLSSPSLSLSSLVISCLAISFRYDTTASLERPIHLSVITFLLTSLTFALRSRWAAPDIKYQSVAVLDGPRSEGWEGLFLTIWRKASPYFNVNWSLLPLTCCLVIRSFSFWFIITNMQCSIPGLAALLPLAAFAIDGLVHLVQPASENKLPSSLLGDNSIKQRSYLAIVAYAACSILFAIGVTMALSKSRLPTGAVCYPQGYVEAYTPVIQLVTIGADAIILVQLSILGSSKTNDGPARTGSLAISFLMAACCMFLMCLPELVYDDMIFWAFVLNYVDMRDLLLDSTVLTLALHCIFNLGSLTPPNLMAAQISFLCASAPLLLSVMPPMATLSTSLLMVVTVAAAGFMIMSARQPRASSYLTWSAALHTSMVRAYTAVVLLGVCILFAQYILFASHDKPVLSLPQAVDGLHQAAVSDFDHWVKTASDSQSLEQAAAAYQSRYGIPAPPGFGDWLQFAVNSSSPVIDTFDQIHRDLLPFWGMKPKEVRDRTRHLLEHAGMGFHGFQVRNGTLTKSPHIPGSHAWMANVMEDMIKPFAKWLPDMEFAINSADEARVTIPFEDMKSLLQNAEEARAWVQAHKPVVNEYESKSSLPSPFPQPSPKMSPSFTNNLRRQLFYDWIARTCPPGSPALSYRWWDKSTICTACQRPHSLSAKDGSSSVPLLLLSNTSLAEDICHQPDLAHLSGLYQTPAAVVSTREPFPVFSQARAGGFSDILFPSPWNFEQKSFYNDSEGVEWAGKQNTLFWRGSSSDGYAARGSWTSFLRARAVHGGYRWGRQHAHGSLSSASSDGLAVNMSFTGEIVRCHQRDCAAERDTFGLWAEPLLPQRGDEADGGQKSKDDLAGATVPFEEHWQYKHLLDMDGAGFSGRFLPFLKSRSLVYRAGVFHAWFDERLRAWNHYVPVDVRLGDGFWRLLGGYLGSGAGAGDEQARKIAERGREWANRALRKEDMQVYMFRLLLEWGRVCSDDRDVLGFGGR